MHRFSFEGVRRVLCLGAHSDDIEIGAGGTILRLARERKDLEVVWVVFSATRQRAEEARRSAALFLDEVAQAEVVVKDFRDGYFPAQVADIKDCFESLKAVRPDLIFTHTSDDRHQDHRVIWDMTWNTFRDECILEYEIIKYDGDLARPNVYVPLSAGDVDRKSSCLMEAFATQGQRDWFTPDTFRAVTRLRGVECRAESGHAEAFVGRKVVF